LPVGVGITGNVASSGTSRAVDNVVGESDGPFKALLESAGIRSAIFVPLKSKGRTVGVFTASSTTSRPFTQEEIALIETIGGQIGSAIESANLFEKMSQMSLTDELTGLCNRRRFNQVVEAEIMRSRRDGRPFSLVMLVLDSFKLHNDTYGHPGGDEVLRSFSSILRSAPRKTDTAFRLGGDEFSIVLPGAGAEVAWNVVNRVASAWAEAQLPGLPGPKIVNGVSVGVAEFPADGDTADRLISVADAELYRSKSAKKQSATVSVPETDRDMGWR
ncbi:MAG: sensor domain-containing diguanylate cyclase, partial [Dehalococcoidia bacterium]|nr:sensor domain-containing diguanylate cyclase [Dehalococcoidia bacterium]